jgi:hypothetical protein
MRLPLVVVGMNGSVGALEALAYALAEAARREGRLLVVSAFRHPDYLAEFTTATPPSLSEIARYTHEAMRSVVGVPGHRRPVTRSGRPRRRHRSGARSGEVTDVDRMAVQLRELVVATDE